MTRRAVITGIGAVTPYGDLDQTVAAIREQRSAIAPVTAFGAESFQQTRGGECRAFEPQKWFRVAKALKLTDRRTRLAVGAASMAVAASHLDATSLEDAGVLIGTSGSDVQTEDVGRALGDEGDASDIDYFGRRVLRRLNPLWLLVNLANMASAHVAIQLGARGPDSTNTTDWIAGLQAIGEASRWIAEGEADVVIAGGADCGVLPFVYASFEASGFFADPAFVPAEGAAVFVIEELEHARKRGATIIAGIDGYASTQGGLPLAIERALAEAQRARDDVDVAETCAPLIGHALAAAAPIDLAVALGAHRGAMLVNSTGACGQAASLVVDNGGVH